MGSNRARRRQELWKRETLAVGNLLLDALALERYLAAQSFYHSTDDLLRQWRNCRRILNRLVIDYLSAVARYRIVIKTSYRVRIRR